MNRLLSFNGNHVLLYQDHMCVPLTHRDHHVFHIVRNYTLYEETVQYWPVFGWWPEHSQEDTSSNRAPKWRARISARLCNAQEVLRDHKHP